MILAYIIAATVLVSLIALVAIFLFFKSGLYRQTQTLISLAAGVLLAVAWLDIVPEALETGLQPADFGAVTLTTIVVFFLVETVFRWHHCQHENCLEKNHKHLAWFNLFGDGIHNFVDGVVIASTFMIDVKLGLITTFAVIIHEIPQELSDASVLSYSGLPLKKIYLYNLLFALTALLGALVAYFYANELKSAPYLLAIAAGNFIYLSMADLMPIIHHEMDRKKIANQVFWFVWGIVLIYLAGVLLAD